MAQLEAEHEALEHILFPLGEVVERRNPWPEEDTWYRADISEVGWDGRVHIVLNPYRVIRRTPKGVWLGWWCQEKFVLAGARKRWACPTKEEALESFRARKERQRKILRAQLRRVERALSTLDKHEGRS